MAKAATSGDFTLEKSLPSNVEAERFILGAILLDNTTVNQAAERLKREDFFLESHRRIYDKMLYLFEHGRAIDPITLEEELRRAGDLEPVGGMAYIAALIDGVPRFSNIDEYTEIVKGKSILRRLITTSNQIMATCFDAEEEPEVILDQAERAILAIAEDRIRQGFVHVSEVAHQQLEYIEEIAGREQLITGIATGFRDLDYLTSGLQRGDLVLIAARPSVGKCLSADTEIVLADGGVATIEEIYRQGRARLLTLNDHWKFKLTSPSAFVDDGQKPVFRVTTRSGREVESTLAHPFLTLDGWRPLAELRPGTRIAVPRRIDIFGEERIRDGEVKLLADLIADGCVTKTSPEFASSHPALQADFAAAVSEFPGVRAIPPVIFKLRREQVALFLNRLWATDGWASVSAGTAEIGYTTVSEKLARQLQHLLLRFGVMASLRKRSVAYLNARRCAWSLSITQADSIRTFATEIGIWGKESALERLLVALNPRDNRSGLDPLPGEIYWDEIVAIEPVGCKQVYDLTIPATHNFVANDICVHNTAFCLNIAQNAATTPQHHGERATVGIFSLEMSKEQLVQRMLCSQARLDAHRLRSGMLSKDDWRRLALAVSELAEARIFIDDTPAISVLEMRAKARRLKNEQRALDLLIVDYLQLMSGRGRIESRQQEVSQISRELKGLAKELHVPLIALSQLSRAPEARTDHRPQLADLRESGSLEQDSDVVMFIYREDVYNPETEKQNIAEVIIGKQRNGPIGKVELVFLKSLTRFENKAYE